MNDVPESNRGYPLIKDTPSKRDQFGPHKRIANAMVLTIEANPDLRTIGVVGPWGSGKSTVLRIFEDSLASHNPPAPPVFTFDAWLHHGEPVRRAFLESFLAFCNPADTKCKDRLNTAADQVTGKSVVTETVDEPAITWGGLAVLASIALGAYGLAKGHSLRRIPYVEQALSRFPDWLPVLLPGLVPLVVILVVALWRACFSPSRSQIGESLLGLILSRQHQSKRTRLSGASAPTAIEFSKVFQDALAKTFSGKQPIIIIDNLDRLPEAEAKEVWAMLRTFFASIPNASTSDAASPIVVVPVAEEVVDAIFKVDSESRGQSFMDKTFDVTFYLPRPVLTAWQDYIGDRLREVFGAELVPDWLAQTTRLVDARYAGASTAITPRSLNTLVNRIATVWLQNRAFNIPFATVAYYCLYGDSVDHILLAPENIAGAPVDVYDGDWRRNIAALHFGVAPDEAMHVLLGGPIRQSIAARDTLAFRHLFAIPGARTMVLRLFSTYRDDATTDKSRVLNSVHVLAGLDESDAPRPEFWLLLANVLPSLVWDTLTHDDVTDLLWLFDHVPGHENRLLAAIQHGLSSIIRKEIVAPEVQARLWTEAYSRHPQAFNGIAPIEVIGTAADFLDVMRLLDSPSGLLLRMTYASPSDVVKELIAYVVSSGDGLDIERQYLAVKHSALEVDWSSLVTKSVSVIRDAGTSSYGNDKPSIERLRTPMLSLIADAERSNLIQQITEALQSKLNWVLSTAIGNALWDLTGYAMAAASIYSLTSIDSNITPPDDAWPGIATAYLRAMILSGVNPEGGMSAIPTPVRPNGPMRLSYKRLMEEVGELMSKTRSSGPDQHFRPVSLQPQS